MGKNAVESSLKSSSTRFFVKTVERPTNEEEMNMTTTVPPNQTIKFTSKFESWFQLSFCKCQMKNQSIVRKEVL